MGSSSTPSTTTTSSEPPAFIQPYLQGAAGASTDLYNQGAKSYYPGSTVVPFSSQTQQSLDLTQQRALNGSPVTQAAQGYSTDVLGGKYLPGGANANPYLDATFNQAAQATRGQLDTQFAGAGRNLGASQAARGDQLNQLATSIYGGAYGQERQNQQAMVPFSTQLANQDYTDLAQLGNVGGQVENLGQQYQQDAVNRFNFGQDAGGTALDDYIRRIQGGYPGGTQTSTQPMYQNRTSGALGGALAGSQIGSNYGGSGGTWGSIIGGLLGAYG